MPSNRIIEDNQVSAGKDMPDGKDMPGGKDMPEDVIVIYVDGVPHSAYAGDTIATVLYAAGRRAWRSTRTGDARGLFCGMGVCFDCLLTVDGVAGERACQVLVREGMEIITSLVVGVDE